MRTTVLGIFLLALTACGSGSSAGSDAAAGQSEGSASIAAAAPAPGDGPPASFAACKSCHAIEPGKHGIGPSLAGVFGKKAGSAAGFVYSKASRSSGLTWDDPTLDAYLTAPIKVMPGTKMSYPGMSDPAKRAEVIAYLRALK